MSLIEKLAIVLTPSYSPSPEILPEEEAAIKQIAPDPSTKKLSSFAKDLGEV